MANQMWNQLKDMVRALFNNVSAEWLTDLMRGTGGSRPSVRTSSGTPDSRTPDDHRKSGDLTAEDESAFNDARVSLSYDEDMHLTFLLAELIDEEKKALIALFATKSKDEKRNESMKRLAEIPTRAEFRAYLESGNMLDPQGYRAQLEKIRKALKLKERLAAAADGAEKSLVTARTKVNEEVKKLVDNHKKRHKNFFW